MRLKTLASLGAVALVIGAAGGRAAASDLMTVYELARASDPQLQAADAQRMARAEAVVQARAALLPLVSGSAQFSDVRQDASSGSPRPFRRPDGTLGFGAVTSRSETNGRSYSITLQQSLYDHRNYTRLRGARALNSQGEAEYQAALQALFIRVAQAYFDALTARANLDAAEAEEKAVGRQLEQAEQRFEVGLTAITDVHEARARHDSARANVILAGNQLNDAYEALAELTGEPIAALKTLNDEIPMTLPEPSDPERWVELALASSPSIAARRFAFESAEHDVATAKAGHYPTLSAQLSRSTGDQWGDFIQNQVVNNARGGNFDTSVGVVLNVPIFEGFGTQSRVRQNVHLRDASAELLEQETRAVVRATRNAYRAVVAGISEVAARRQALVSARSALEATQAGFEVGTRTIVDVLLSQQQLFAAEREYARARHNLIVAGLRLKQSAGVIDVADIAAVNGLLGKAAAPSAPDLILEDSG